jgi:flagellar biosynthesis/type III secretory pathway protein FliH
MPQFVVKKKSKLGRVEIIPLEKAKLLEDLIYNPFKHNEEVFEFEEFDKAPEEELPPPEPVELKQRFYREFQFTNIRELIPIDLRRVPPLAVLKEQHDIEMSQAFDDGYNQCLSEVEPVHKAEKQELEGWIRNFDNLSEELNTQFSIELKNFEETLINLSVMIAEHILDKEISAHSSIVVDQVRKAISSVEEDKIFKIRINPNNISVLDKVKSTLFDDKSKLQGISIVADDSIDLGGCILETSAGIVDGRIKTQLEIVSNQILNSGIEESFVDDVLIDEFENESEFENLEFHTEVAEEIKPEIIQEIKNENHEEATFESSPEDLENDFLKDLQNFDFGEDK